MRNDGLVVMMRLMASSEVVILILASSEGVKAWMVAQVMIMRLALVMEVLTELVVAATSCAPLAIPIDAKHVPSIDFHTTFRDTP